MDLKQKLTEKLQESKRFVGFVARHFIEDDCPYRASALAFSTLLAIVPMMAVGFAILSTFPAFQNLVVPIQNFIFANFVPSTGQIIQNYLQLLATQASKLSSIGVFFLFIVALLVMYTIEQAMNKIWRINSSRHGISAFLLYWAIVSLAPFLLGLSIVVSSYFLSLPFVANHDMPALINILPFLFSLAGFTFLYVVVPNGPVRFLHGFYGGLIAALLFESAKLAFAYYLSNYNVYQLLYGAFATVPIFLVWIYWVWFITLLGAEISYAFSVHHLRRPGCQLDGFSHVLLWLYQLSLAQREGKELTIDELINASKQAYAVDIDDMLMLLIDLKLIKTTRDGHYVLSRDLNHLTLYELTQIVPYPLPSSAQWRNHNDMIGKGWQKQIQKADDLLKETLMISLGQLFRGN
jgi:membrane protein